jgi:hypothetical protein
VFLSASISLQERALAEGGNAVANIQYNDKSNRVSDEKTFRSGAGKFVTGVALIGDVMTIEK